MSNKTPTYKSWKEMRSRCNNKNNDNYKWYGGAGISVCDRWDSYESFLEDMGERPAGTSIDRIDVTGNYEPSNCRWATPSEQAETNRGCIKKGCTPPNKLPQEEIKLMIEMRKSGAKIKDIAMRFGRHSSNVSVWLRYGN